jgi:hypothetical protein
MKPVKREEFEHRSDLEVLHRPTGTNVSTYRYQNPDEACSSIKVNFGTADDEYDRWEICRVACELLRESARP